MTSRLARLLLTSLFAAFLLGACSSSDNSVDDTAAGTDSQNNNPQLEDEGQGTQDTSDQTDTSGQADTTDQTDTSDQADTTDQTDTSDQTDTADNAPVGTSGDDVGDDPAENEPVGQTDNTVAMLIPVVQDGSDLERLIGFISQQTFRSLIDLNSRLAEGTLTEQQDECLGAFDPAAGEQLLAMDCEQPLATGDVALFVGEAAVYDTDECHASLFDGSTDGCQLQYASILAPALFEIPETGGLPMPTFSGAQINYAIDGTLLTIESLEDAPTGLFKCDIDLSLGTTASPLAGHRCPDIVLSVADRLDTLLN